MYQTAYESNRMTIVTLYDDVKSKNRIAEVRNYKRSGRWIWECRACRSSDCDHVMQAKSWLRQRRAEQEAIWRRMDALYPAEPARPRVRFAPCTD